MYVHVACLVRPRVAVNKAACLGRSFTSMDTKGFANREGRGYAIMRTPVVLSSASSRLSQATPDPHAIPLSEPKLEDIEQ